MKIGKIFCLLMVGLLFLGRAVEAKDCDGSDCVITEEEKVKQPIPVPSPTPSPEPVPPLVALSFEWDFYSQYIWRGIESSQGPVWQPAAAIEGYGVGFSVWGNFVLGDEPNQGQFNEIDLTLYYHRQFKKLDVNTWFVFELYPNSNPKSLNDSKSTIEYDLILTYPVGPVFVFSDLAVFLMFAQGGVYWDVGLGYEQALPLGFSFRINSLFALTNGPFNQTFVTDVGTQPYMFQTTFGFPWNPFSGSLKDLSFYPNVQVSTLLTSALRDAVAHPTLIRGGVAVSYRFGIGERSAKRH